MTFKELKNKHRELEIQMINIEEEMLATYAQPIWNDLNALKELRSDLPISHAQTIVSQRIQQLKERK